MPTRSIVEHLDIFKDVCASHFPGFVDSLFDTFLFQATEEGFGDGIAPRGQASRSQQLPRRLMLGSS